MIKQTFAAVALMGLANAVDASTILSAISADASSTYGGDTAHYGIEHVIDQSGLYNKYVSGVTDFDAYIASGPKHDYLAPNNEWFGKRITFTGSYPKGWVSFDLGQDYSIDRFALWNEEVGGIRSGTISYSLDGIFYTTLMTFKPKDNPAQLSGTGADHRFDYLPEVFSFDQATLARYFRIDMTCAQPNGTYVGCSMGEIAFSNVTATPLPAAGYLFAPALLAFMRLGRKSAGKERRA